MTYVQELSVFGRGCGNTIKYVFIEHFIHLLALSLFMIES